MDQNIYIETGLEIIIYTCNEKKKKHTHARLEGQIGRKI